MSIENKVYQQQAIIAAAKANGVRFGRPEKQLPEDFISLVKQWENKKITLSEILKQCKMSESTFYRRLREYRIKAK